MPNAVSEQALSRAEYMIPPVVDMASQRLTEAGEYPSPL